MLEQQTRHSLLAKLQTYFDNCKALQASLYFEADISDLVCSSYTESSLFRANPSKYLDDLLKQLKECLDRIPEQGESEKEAYERLKKIVNTHIFLTNIPYTHQIYKYFSEINSDSIGKWIVVTGTVIQSMQKKSLDKSKVFACCQCGFQYRACTSYENSYRFETPLSCTNMIQKEKSNSIIAQLYHNFHLRKSKSKEKSASEDVKLKLEKCGCARFDPTEWGKICIDYQELRVQQQFQYISSGKIPQTLTIILQGDIAGPVLFRPGDDLTITGQLGYRYKKLIKDFVVLPQLVLVANSITIEKTNNYNSENSKKLNPDSETQMSKIYANFPLNYYNTFNLTAKERVIIKQLQFRREIIASFCPSIYGRNMVKLGLILSLLGGVSFENQSSKIRGNSHVLLVGEPGTGKSVLLQEAAKLAERSFFTNGIGTTSAGLSVSYFKEGGDWMIEAGALVLADNGVCCIDQLTLLSKKDEKSLLQSMEQQTISSAKASVIGKLNARTTVICACNPIRQGQKYDSDVDLEANTGLSIPLLTRFDMIFIMKDERDPSEDAQKCDYILEKFSRPTSSQNYTQMSQHKNKEKLDLKSVLKKCKGFNPELTSHEILTIYYTSQRQQESKVKTARAFESLCRIAEAHAKLMLRDTTILLDYVTAISLTENSYFSTIEQYYALLDEFNAKHKTNFS